jgi:hypothetical protein
MSPEDIRELAECMIDPSRKVNRKRVSATVQEARRMMAEEKVSEEDMDALVPGDGPVSPLEIMEAATDKALDEKLRKSAIGAIVKCITSKGFVVDRRNIRHVKETDTVIIMAMKPGGQKAEFSVDLNGKFMYHFQGYEGLSCEKDISSMEKNLEEVYGIRLADKKTIWSNPDKLSKYHHTSTEYRRADRCR